MAEHWKTRFPRGKPQIRYVNDDAASSSGTVTNIATGYGITGGPITTTGTLAANLTATTRYVLNNVTTAATTAVDYTEIAFDTLEAAGHLTYLAGTWTCVNAGTYRFTITAMHNTLSSTKIPLYIKKNGAANLYELTMGSDSATLTMTYSLVATDTVAVMTDVDPFTTINSGVTNFATVERIA